MRARIKLEKEKMPEREVREHIEKAAERMKQVHEQRGQGGMSYEKVREKMQQQAELDHRKGKI